MDNPIKDKIDKQNPADPGEDDSNAKTCNIINILRN